MYPWIVINLIQRFFQTGDPVDHAVGQANGSAQEIDRLLCELGQLYIQRSQAMRSNKQADLGLIVAKIDTVKSKLSNL